MTSHVYTRHTARGGLQCSSTQSPQTVCILSPALVITCASQRYVRTYVHTCATVPHMDSVTHNMYIHTYVRTPYSSTRDTAHLAAFQYSVTEVHRWFKLVKLHCPWLGVRHCRTWLGRGRGWGHQIAILRETHTSCHRVKEPLQEGRRTGQDRALTKEVMAVRSNTRWCR